MKRVGILLVFIFFGGGFSVAKSMDTQEVSSAMIEKYQKTPMWQLLGIADAFLSKGANDSAMICYSLIYNSRMNQEDTSSKKIVCKALNRASNIYFYHCDYKSSIQLLLMALQICDEIGYKEYVASVYNNIGSVYFQFKDNKKAKKYYELSNKNSHNAYFSGVVLNNLALLACRENKLDSALILYKKACRIIEKEVLDSVYNETLNNIGNVYYTLGHYDSAFFYYCKALDNARKFKMASKEAYILSDIGRLYYHRHKYDSADYYLKMGNKIAIQYKLYSVLANNYLSFSEIQESQGNISQALAYYKKYDIIKDSLFNSSKYASIQELEFSYNMTKIDKKIQKLNVEQEIKERTIAMQKRLQLVTSLAVLALSALLVLMYRKNKNLNQAYNKLVVKNVEIVNFEAKMQFMQVEYEYKLRQKDLKIEQVQQE
ncbi:MAG: tetratricopeptide repeat protein, partial [Bacteroidales bacterium]